MKAQIERTYLFHFEALHRVFVTDEERTQLFSRIMKTGSPEVTEVIRAGYYGLESFLLVHLTSDNIEKIYDAVLRVAARFPGGGSWKLQDVLLIDN